MGPYSNPTKTPPDAIETLTARVAELEKALAPFAKTGEIFDPMPKYDMQVYWPEAGDEFRICGKDLYRARAALKPKE